MAFNVDKPGSWLIDSANELKHMMKFQGWVQTFAIPCITLPIADMRYFHILIYIYILCTCVIYFVLCYRRIVCVGSTVGFFPSASSIAKVSSIQYPGLNS